MSAEHVAAARVTAVSSGPGKSAFMARFAEQWLREHPGAVALDLKSEPARRVLLATCGYCWAASGEHCAGGPGSHLARWIRAERKGLIIGTELAAALEKLDDIAASVKVGTI